MVNDPDIRGLGCILKLNDESVARIYPVLVVILRTFQTVEGSIIFFIRVLERLELRDIDGRKLIKRERMRISGL